MIRDERDWLAKTPEEEVPPPTGEPQHEPPPEEDEELPADNQA